MSADLGEQTEPNPCHPLPRLASYFLASPGVISRHDQLGCALDSPVKSKPLSCCHRLILSRPRISPIQKKTHDIAREGGIPQFMEHFGVGLAVCSLSTLRLVTADPTDHVNSDQACPPHNRGGDIPRMADADDYPCQRPDMAVLPACLSFEDSSCAPASNSPDPS